MNALTPLRERLEYLLSTSSVVLMDGREAILASDIRDALDGVTYRAPFYQAHPQGDFILDHGVVRDLCEHMIPARECRVVGCSGISEVERRALDGDR